jgi:hypothetical protein
MIALFDGKPILSDFDDFYDEIFVLNTSLSDYFDTFVSRDAPYFYNRFIEGLDENNEFSSVGDWHNPETRFTTLAGLRPNA